MPQKTHGVEDFVVPATPQCTGRSGGRDTAAGRIAAAARAQRQTPGLRLERAVMSPGLIGIDEYDDRRSVAGSLARVPDPPVAVERDLAAGPGPRQRSQPHKYLRL